MAVSLTYPGIYFQEFTPGPPIEGVGTSTAAFIGTAEMGPVGRPTRLSSWDAFQARFGGLSAEPPAASLPPAVLGFFLNGGTDCFVVRASEAKHSAATLLSRRTPTGEPLIVAEAIDEGTQGDAIEIEIRNSSPGILESLLPAGQTALDVHRGQTTLGTNPLSTDRTQLTVPVADFDEFQAGERITLTPPQGSTAQPRTVVIAEKRAPNQLVLMTALGGPLTVTFANWSVRSANLEPGQREIRVDVPTGVRLDRALPHGATVRIRLGTGAADIRTVDTTRDSVDGASITLTAPLSRAFSLATTAPTVESLEFDVLVERPGSMPEGFRQLSVNAEHPSYWGRLVTSALVTLRPADPPPANPADDPRPAEGRQKLAGGDDDNRARAWSNLLNDPADQLKTLEVVKEVDIVAIPGATTQSAQDALIAHCLKLADRFAILDPEPGADIDAIATQADRVRARDGFAALYWPSILVRNPKTRRVEAWPPSGHLAGVYARTDGTSGVHTAPANTGIEGAIGVVSPISDLDQGPLNLAGINVLRVFPGNSRPSVWGARTTWLDNRYWQYISTRRLFLFLEQSIERGIRPAIFMPNEQSLWADLRRVINAFLTQVWRDGAMFGATPDEAFYVRIDEGLNPESERALGRLHIEIGIRPAYPAEFIVVRIGISAEGAEISET